MTSMDNMVAITDVAEYFKVGVSTVRGWIRQGIVPAQCYVKAGGQYRFDLMAMRESFRVPPFTQLRLFPDAPSTPAQTAPTRLTPADIFGVDESCEGENS